MRTFPLSPVARLWLPTLALLLPLLAAGCGGGTSCDGYTQNGGCAVSATPTPSGPVVSGLSPSSGPAAGGTTVTITGQHFTDNNQTPLVLFVANASQSNQTIVDAKITQSSNTSLTVTTPPGTGTVDVIVSGLVYSGIVKADQFTYN